MWHRWIFAVCMYVCTQDGRFNCLQCAARYGRTELFHHMVQRYGCDPKEKDCYNGVSSACIRLCVWRGVGGTVGSRVIYNIICTICHGCRQVVAGLPFTPPVTMVTKHWQGIWFPNTDWTPMNQRMWVYHSWSVCVLCVALYSPLIAVGLTCFCFAQNGVTATALAIQRGHTEVVQDLLEKFGASLRLARNGLVC